MMPHYDNHNRSALPCLLRSIKAAAVTVILVITYNGICLITLHLFTASEVNCWPCVRSVLCCTAYTALNVHVIRTQCVFIYVLSFVYLTCAVS